MDGGQLIAVAGLCIVAAVLCRVYDGGAMEYGVLLKTAAVLAVLGAVASASMPIFSKIQELYAKTGGDSEYPAIMLKSVGICYLTRLAADICRDSGESALASSAEAAGKISLLVLALPLFDAAAQTAEHFLYSY